jgi:hypothetical protein
VRWERYCNFQHISKSGGATLRTDARSDAFGEQGRSGGHALAGAGSIGGMTARRRRRWRRRERERLPACGGELRTGEG